MDLSYSDEYLAFRDEVRNFIEQHREQVAEIRGRKQATEWQKLLIKNGYAARTIPKEYGGYGAEPDILKSRIIGEEFAGAQVPMGFADQGISMLVPTLLEKGTEAQKKQYIEPTITGGMRWCQGYSEPGSGSDLASLRTVAVVDGDDFVINGQKIWTSTANEADMMFCLVRTEPDAPKHQGISYLLIPMETPGIEVRPLVTMTGHAEFNEVFLTDVRVPVTQIVGERGEGWKVANTTLKHERGMLGDPNATQARFQALVNLLREEQADGQALIQNPLFRNRLLELQGRVLAMQFNGLRILTASAKSADATLARLIVKLNGCELNHQIAALAIDALGELGVLYHNSTRARGGGSWQWNYMFQLGLIIGGGTAQIQKNIISERGLGMPREPKAQKQGA